MEAASGRFGDLARSRPDRRDLPIVGFAFIWLVLSTTGLFSQLNSLINSAGSTTADVGSALSLPRVLSFAGTLAIVDIVLGTVLAGISSLIFNVIARITGGVRVGFTNE